MEADKAEFDRLDAEIVALSVDHIAALKAWASSLGGISYPMASDFWPHGAVARRYGVFREDDGYAERAILIVDKSGKIAYIDIHEMDEPPEVEEILEALRDLQGRAPGQSQRAA